MDELDRKVSLRLTYCRSQDYLDCLLDALCHCIEENLTPRIISDHGEGNLNIFGHEEFDSLSIPYVRIIIEYCLNTQMLLR